MAAAWITPPVVWLSLIVMLWRRLISPIRFAQAVSGIAIGTLLTVAAGDGHG